MHFCATSSRSTGAARLDCFRTLHTQRRNDGATEQAVPPHKIVGNVYYVGTETLASFLVTTPQGHILINTDYERNNAVIRDSVTKLGFKFEDIKIILGSHAHGDHMEGDALAKQQTGAQVMAMAEDVPALQGSGPEEKNIRLIESYMTATR